MNRQEYLTKPTEWTMEKVTSLLFLATTARGAKAENSIDRDAEGRDLTATLSSTYEDVRLVDVQRKLDEMGPAVTALRDMFLRNARKVIDFYGVKVLMEVITKYYREDLSTLYKGLEKEAALSPSDFEKVLVDLLDKNGLPSVSVLSTVAELIEERKLMYQERERRARKKTFSLSSFGPLVFSCPVEMTLEQIRELREVALEEATDGGE